MEYISLDADKSQVPIFYPIYPFINRRDRKRDAAVREHHHLGLAGKTLAGENDGPLHLRVESDKEQGSTGLIRQDH